MRNMTAFCGLDCAACPAYIATQAGDSEGLRKTAERWSKELGLNITADDCVCDGCASERTGGYCAECPMRACNIQRGYEHCGQCPDYMCENLSRFVSKAKEAGERLEELRKP